MPRPGLAVLQADRERRRAAGRGLSPAGAAARRRAGCSRRMRHAMMDVSDGLLLDATRLAEASGCGAAIDLDALPLSAPSSPSAARIAEARLFAATGGDDYALLAALPPDSTRLSLSLPSGTTIARIGTLDRWQGLASVSTSAAEARAVTGAAWAMNIAALPLRQWLIAPSGLASRHGDRAARSTKRLDRTGGLPAADSPA